VSRAENLSWQADRVGDSCCPDVLSCLHLPADFLVHYGHACLTPWVSVVADQTCTKLRWSRTDALPVHYVFPRAFLNVDGAVSAFMEESRSEMQERKGVIVVWDVAYDHLAG
jgi:diphthamide biosynthesis protein 2